MDALALSSLPTASPSVIPGASPLADATADGVRGADFANLLSQMMQAGQRQDLAAAPGLQALALSPNIEVITADEPLPDSASLLAFARGQGLDDGMLQSLFPSAVMAAAAASDALAAQASGPAGPSTAAPAGSEMGVANLLSAGQLTAGGQADQVPVGLQVLSPATSNPALALAQAGVGPAAAPIPAWARAGLPEGSVQVQSVVVHQAPVAVAVAAAALVAGPAGDAAADAPEAGMAHTLAGLAHVGRPRVERLQSPAALLAADADPAASAGVAGSQASAQVAAGQGERAAMQEVMRLQLQSQERLTQRLAGLAATGAQAVWGQLASQPVADVLSLAMEPGQALAEKFQQAEGPAPTAQPAPAAGAALGREVLAEPAAAASTAADRAEHYEQLAQRLGQALGQRLQSQIERGQWKVQLQVDPQALGRIDMELEMRGGGLEAVFRSDNQATRDLIVQGLPRLRETLNQSGTTVANFWVQGDSSRQSGGNPTPGRWAQPSPARVSAAPEADQPLEPVSSLRPRADGSGWDMLA